MTKLFFLASTLAFLSAPANAGPPTPQMPAGEFLGRAEPLLKRSMASLLLSAEARGLARTIGRAADNHRTALEAERSAGRRVATCLPKKNKDSIVPQEFLTYLRKLSPQEKAQSLQRAVGGYMDRKYPCAG